MRLPIVRLTILITVACLASAPCGAQDARSTAEILRNADSAWTAGDQDVALTGYEEIVRRDPAAARATFRLATLLAWRSDLARATSLFRRYVSLEPADDDGRVALARTLAWDARYDEAAAIYEEILVRAPRHRDAWLGAAQVMAWRGRLSEASGRYEAWLRDHEEDADAWASLGQARHWAGRLGPAREALRQAVALRPDHEDAVAQLRIVEATLAPSLEPMVITTDDSDDNRSTTVVIESGLAMPWGQRLVAGVRHRSAELGATRGSALTLRAASGWLSPDGRWSLRGEAGATRLAGHVGGGASTTRTEPLVAARAAGRVVPGVTLGIGASRLAFDETAPLILSGIVTTTIEGDVDVAFGSRLSLGMGGGVTTLAGGSVDNRRTAVSGALRWTLTPRLSVGAGVRSFGYERAAADGYFAPKQYLLAEGRVQASAGGDLGWRLDADVGAGQQTIRAFDDSRSARFAQRASATLAYRPAPGVEWRLNGGFANVASPTTIGAAEYRVWSMSLGARVRL